MRGSFLLTYNSQPYVFGYKEENKVAKRGAAKVSLRSQDLRLNTRTQSNLNDRHCMTNIQVPIREVNLRVER
jgi:hypothetical protein